MLFYNKNWKFRRVELKLLVGDSPPHIYSPLWSIIFIFCPSATFPLFPHFFNIHNVIYFKRNVFPSFRVHCVFWIFSLNFLAYRILKLHKILFYLMKFWFLPKCNSAELTLYNLVHFYNQKKLGNNQFSWHLI